MKKYLQSSTQLGIVAIQPCFSHQASCLTSTKFDESFLLNFQSSMRMSTFNTWYDTDLKSKVASFNGETLEIVLTVSQGDLLTLFQRPNHQDRLFRPNMTLTSNLENVSLNC